MEKETKTEPKKATNAEREQRMNEPQQILFVILCFVFLFFSLESSSRAPDGDAVSAQILDLYLVFCVHFGGKPEDSAVKVELSVQRLFDIFCLSEAVLLACDERKDGFRNLRRKLIRLTKRDPHYYLLLSTL